MTRKHLLFTFVIIPLFTIIIVAGYLGLTTAGAEIATRFFLSKYANEGNINFKELNGSLISGVMYTNLEVDHLRRLPQGSVLRIQKLFVRFIPTDFHGLFIDVENGRVLLPTMSEPIVFGGSVRNGILDFNVFTRSVSVEDVLEWIPKKFPKKISGTVNDIDIWLKGPYVRPHITGEFYIKELSTNGFSAVNCPGNLTLELKNIPKALKVRGEIAIQSGTLSGTKTALITLQQSKIFFVEDPTNPNFAFNGNSDVEGTKIHIVLKGTIKKPDLQLSSFPPMPQELLLVMLATGKSWKGTQGMFSSNQIPADMAKDFIDYFAFSGQGRKMAERFGISDISVKYDNQTKGIGVTKDLTKRLKANYEVDQTHQIGQPTPHMVQKVGGEYGLTDKLSAEATKEVLSQSPADASQETEKPDNQLLLKYKKQF